MESFSAISNTEKAPGSISGILKFVEAFSLQYIPNFAILYS